MNFITANCEDGTSYIIPYENIDFIVSNPGKYYTVWVKGYNTSIDIEGVIGIEYE